MMNNSKRFRYIIVIAVLSTFLVLGSATARTIISYNTAYAAVGVNPPSSSATTPTTQLNPYTSAKILLQDGISALQQDNDTSKALMHMKLAYQQLTSIGENSSSSIQPTKILLQDGISALQQDNDTSKALMHLKLAYQQLSSPSNTASLPSSSAVNSHVGSVTTSPAPFSSSPSARSTSDVNIINRNHVSPPRVITQSLTPSSQTPAPKKDKKSPQCDARCISLAQQDGISLAKQNAKEGITMSSDKIKNSSCVHHTDQYCTILKKTYQDEYYLIATGKLPPIIDVPPTDSDCSRTSAPTCSDSGIRQAYYDTLRGTVNDNCPSSHPKDYCGPYLQKVSDLQKQIKSGIPIPVPPTKVTAPAPQLIGSSICNNQDSKEFCKTTPLTAGQNPGNVPCQNGHNPNQPKGVAGCRNDKNLASLAQLQPTSSPDCLNNPAIGMPCPNKSETTSTPLSPPSQVDCTKNPSDSSCNQPSNLSTLSAQSGNPNTALLGPIPTESNNNPSSIDNNPTPVAPNTKTVDTCTQDPNADGCKTSPSFDTTAPPDTTTTTSGTTPSSIGDNNGAPIDNGGGTTGNNLLSSSPDSTTNNSPVDNSGDATTIQSSPPHNHHHHNSVSSTDNLGSSIDNSALSSDNSGNSGDSGSSDSGGGSSDSGSSSSDSGSSDSGGGSSDSGGGGGDSSGSGN